MYLLSKKAMDEEQKKIESKMHWIAFYSGEIMRIHGWYSKAKQFPGTYIKGAEKSFAKIALDEFKALYKLDKGSAKMIFDSYRFEFDEMIKEIGECKEDYWKMFY